MLSIKTIVGAVALIATTVRADYYIDPDSVSLSLRSSWCTTEESSCPIICDQTSPGTPLVNTCDPTTLTYGCVCSDSKQPNISEYSLTLPYFTCQEWGTQCVAGCGSDNACASACRADHPCGALSPKRVNTSTISSTATATGTGTQTASANAVFTGLDGSGSTSTSTPAGNAAAPSFEKGSLIGSLTLVVGVIVGFGLLI